MQLYITLYNLHKYLSVHGHVMTEAVCLVSNCVYFLPNKTIIIISRCTLKLVIIFVQGLHAS